MARIEEKFDKAVNLIRSLPKDGSYQPSNELQLRFYAFYKQATEGYNCHPRPSFWEVVKRAKWDAWSNLGNMSKEDAMIRYVDELRKIVETMSYTENVAVFLNAFDEFCNKVPPADLELLVGPVLDEIRSRPNSPLIDSPLASRDTSPSRAVASSLCGGGVANPRESSIVGSVETSPSRSYTTSPIPLDTDEEDDHFLDTEMELEGREFTRQPGKSDAVSAELYRSTRPETARARRPGHGTHEGAGKVMVKELTLTSEIECELLEIKRRLQSMEDIVQPNLRVEFPPVNKFFDNRFEGDSTVDIYRMVVANLGREIDVLRRRMTIMERVQRREIQTRNTGNASWRRLGGIPVQSTILFMAWPVLVILLARWISIRYPR